VPLFLPPEAYARAVSDLARLADAAGRDPGCITRAVVAFVSVGEAARATERGLGWMSSLYGLPAKAFARHLLAGPAAYCADQVSRWYQAGAEHVVVYVTADDPLAQFEDLAGELEAMKGTRLAQVATGEVVATGAL
jgi:alkanesulfonate monooxygenase SsuD/methylene tetrahydromethanopterin reductase-like flavin-dependent oxidoreductase (luciferase family)